MAADDLAAQTTPVLLTYLDDGLIASIVLNRPERRNAIDRAMAKLLLEHLATVRGNTGVRVLMLTGSGDRAFSAGADLLERGTMMPAERSDHTAAIRDVAEAIGSLPIPVIGAVRGYAIAGGAEIAIACDLRVGGDATVFGFPEVKIGIFPGGGGAVRLPRLVPPGIARDLLYTGRQIGPEEAYRHGLVDRLVSDGEVEATALELARSIAANAPLAIRALKQALILSEGRPTQEASAIVEELRTPLDQTDDYEEGLRAFAERRPPRFTGA